MYFLYILNKNDKRFIDYREIFRFINLLIRLNIFAFKITYYKIIIKNEPYFKLNTFYNKKKITRRFKIIKFLYIDDLIADKIIYKY